VLVFVFIAVSFLTYPAEARLQRSYWSLPAHELAKQKG
jgi:hypothetical protein